MKIAVVSPRAVESCRDGSRQGFPDCGNCAGVHFGSRIRDAFGGCAIPLNYLYMRV
jgi:hypothetical protein